MWANEYYITTATTVSTSSIQKVRGHSVRCVAYLKEKYTVNINHEGSTGATGANDYKVGDTVTINAGTAIEGRKFLKWIVESGGITLSNLNNVENKFIMPVSDVTLTAVFVSQYTLELAEAGEGALGAGIYFEADTVTIKAGTGPIGKKFQMWNTQSSGVNWINAYSETAKFVMPGNNVRVTPKYYDSTLTYNGKTYGVVTIKDRKWMAENLNYQPTSGNSWCYNNADSNCVKYGRLYDWTTAMGIDESYTSETWKGFDFPHQGICPSGWHLPNKAELDTLVEYAGGSSVAGAKLKAKSGWYNNLNGTDDFGFSGQPGGTWVRSFNQNGQRGRWWASTNNEAGTSYFLDLFYSNGAVAPVNSDTKIYGYSVRCVAYLKDEFAVEVKGDGTGATGGGNYKPGEKVTITAGTPSAGKFFSKWTTQNAGVVFDDAFSATTAFTMPGGNDVTVTANFGEKYTVEIVNAGENAVGNGQHVAGGLVTIKAGTAPAGKKFYMWTTQSNDVNFNFDYGTTTTFIMPEHDVTVSAEFWNAFKDERDQKTYRWVSIGKQRWMAENLNYDPQKSTGSWCYENSADSCGKYGRLYDWATAMNMDASYNTASWTDAKITEQGVCPDGWHLPRNAEWDTLIKVGGYANGLYAKKGWEVKGGDLANGIDAYGFTILPGGMVDENGVFGSIGLESRLRAVEQSNATVASVRRSYTNQNYPQPNIGLVNYSKRSGASVRCVATNKAQVTIPTFTPPTDFVYNGKLYSAGIPENDHYTVINGERRDAGICTTRVVLKDTLTYEWSDGTIKPLEFEWSIEKASARPFVRPEAARVVYRPNLTLSEVVLPEGYAWADSVKATVLEATDDGRSFAAAYDDPNGNYHTAYGYIDVKFVNDAQRLYKVVVSNGGAGASEAAKYASGAAVTITAGTHPQGLFRKWTTQSDGVTFADEYDETTTFTMPENDVIAMANFMMTFKDGRDETTYKMVNIGRQRWMAENLNYYVTGSNCYDGISENCDTYGRLYTWAAAMDIDESYNTEKWGGSDFKHRGVCPVGWHLPDTSELSELLEVTDGNYMNGKTLRTTSGWVDILTQGTDDFGFSAMPGGNYSAWVIPPRYSSVYYSGRWVGSTEYNEKSMYNMNVGAFINQSVTTLLKKAEVSIRCIADKQVVVKPTVTNTSLVYNGHEQWAGIPSSPDFVPVTPIWEYTVTGDNAVRAGDYTATVILDTANFMWADGTTDRVLHLPWKISPAPGHFVPLVIDTTYSPTLKLTDFTLPKGYAWTSSTDSTAHLNAGNGQTFAATFTDTSGNYRTVSGTITVNVAKAPGLTEVAPTTISISGDNTAINTFNLSGIVLDPTDHGKLSYDLGEIIDGEGPEGKILASAPTMTVTDTTAWLTYQGSGKTSGTATQVIKITSQNYEDIDITITFKATPEAVYGVTVNSGTGSGSYKAGDTVSITATTADHGKVFAKWATADSIAFIPGDTASSATFAMPRKDVTVTAVYRDTVYKILFIAEGGTVSPEFGMTVSGTGRLDSLPTPTRTGYTFSGWYTNGGDRVETTTPFRSDVAIFAHWTLPIYNVTWVADGGAPEPKQDTVSYIGSITEPDSAVRKAGHVFGGWYLDSTFSDTAKFPIKNVTSDITLYAKWEINSYVITWWTNGGTSAPVLVSAVTYGGSIDSAMSAGSKAGYAFDGWYLNDSLTAKATFPVNDITENKSFYAKWVPAYTITFNAKGGTVTPTSAVTGAGGKLDSLPTPTRDGYTFDAWYTDTTYITKATVNTEFSKNDTIYAHWVPVIYTVTFRLTYGGSATPSSIPVGTNGKLPYWPEVTPLNSNTIHYVFDGWYTTNTYATKVDTSTVLFTANTELFGRWATVPIFAITFNPAGGAVSPAVGATGPDSTLSISLPVPVKDGYTFDGWWTDSTGGARVTSSTKFTANGTIYAHWTTGAVTYTIWFNANGGAVSPASGTTGAGGTLVSALPTPTWSGHAFDGWYTTRTAGAKVTQSTAFTSTDTIFAHWTLANYTVTFLPNGGTVTPTTVLVNADDGKLPYLPVPRLSLYAFDGWYTAPTGGTKVTLNTVFNGDEAVFAHWIPLYIIRFNANGGTVSLAADTTGADGKLAALPTPVPANNGETFKGWFTAPASGTMVTLSTVFTGDATLYAQWAPAAVSYTVTFNPNGGLVNPTSRVTTGDGTLAALPTPARENYAFTGWFTSATVGSTVVTTDYVFTGNTTIYARWVPIYTVTFNPNNGVVNPTSAKVNAEGLIEGSLPVPTRAGYRFDGWFTTSAATGGLEVTADYVFSANTTVYARWTLMVYTIIFDANGSTVTVSSGLTGTGGRLSSLPTPAARTGYVFDGWFTELSGGTRVTTSTAFTGDATIYAQWSPIYRVTFNANGGTVTTASANTGAGGKLASLPTPTRTAYTFVGWFTESTESEGGTIVTTSTVFDGDATIYARWSQLTNASVTFSAGTNGKLRATVDDLPITPGAAVGIGKNVVFTAVPDDGYRVVNWTINGTDLVDTSTVYVHAGLSNTTTVSVSFERRISITSPNREIPSGVTGEVTAITPLKALPGIVTAGPNPVKVGRDAAIYWTGGKAVKGRLSVFNAVGGKVASINVKGVNKIGTWKVGDVAEGTYLIKGVLTDKNGVRVVVSLLVGVVR
jgi:uncharacterized protein (TIGR02145 family)/uncharacterized repeat protein (TIGR02543 family)